MNLTGPFLLFGSALLLGLRHGIDWDHIAAITDITSSSETNQEGFLLGLVYAVGHATVIVTLGLLAVVIGVTLPHQVDRLMEPVVGLTLILLSLWVTASIVHHLTFGQGSFRPRSRWMLLFDLIEKTHHFFHSKTGEHLHLEEKNHKSYSLPAVFGIGLIHGIGAETPTQVVLFATAAGLSGRFSGLAILLVFVLGLLIANTLIVVLANFGYSRIANNAKVWVTIGAVTAVFSFLVGLSFLTGHTPYLPALFGG